MYDYFALMIVFYHSLVVLCVCLCVKGWALTSDVGYFLGHLVPRVRQRKLTVDQTVDRHLALVQVLGDLDTVGAVHQCFGDLQAPQPLSESKMRCFLEPAATQSRRE